MLLLSLLLLLLPYLLLLITLYLVVINECCSEAHRGCCWVSVGAGGVCKVIFVSNPITVLRLCYVVLLLGLWQFLGLNSMASSCLVKYCPDEFMCENKKWHGWYSWPQVLYHVSMVGKYGGWNYLQNINNLKYGVVGWTIFKQFWHERSVLQSVAVFNLISHSILRPLPDGPQLV